MSSVDNVTTSKPKVGGAAYCAPVGTALPTDASTALNAAFKPLGYISDEGLTNANSPSGGSIKAWGGDTVQTYLSDKPDTFAFALIEALNLDVLKAVYGSTNVSGTLTTGITVNANSAAQDACSWVFETVLKGAVKRIVVPQASITALADIVYGDEDAVGYGITITALPDDDANTHYEYILTSAPPTPTP